MLKCDFMKQIHFNINDNKTTKSNSYTKIRKYKDTMKEGIIRKTNTADINNMQARKIIKELNEILININYNNKTKKIENEKSNETNEKEYQKIVDEYENIDTNELSNHQTDIKDLNKELIKAIKKKRKEEIERIIQAGADVNKKSMSLRRTPLHYAVLFGDSEIVELLIKNGAKVDEFDIFKKTPLHYALYYRKFKTAKILAAYKADYNLPEGWFSRKPFHSAAASGDLEKVKFFIQIGTDVNDTNTLFNDTPLNSAVSTYLSPISIGRREDYLQVIEYLLQHGANPNIKDKFGMTTFQIISVYGRKKAKTIKQVLNEKIGKESKTIVEEVTDLLTKYGYTN